MTNFGAKILGNAVSSLTAQQAVIATTGNNIANANTPGYTRRVVNLESRQGSSGLSVGNGVQIGDIERVTDKFLERIFQEATSTQSSADTTHEFLKRVESVFDLTDGRQTIGSTLTEFFTAVNDLTADPASIELRVNMLERANDLVNVIKSTYDNVASLQSEANQRLGTEVAAINSLTAQIAEMNSLVAAREAGGGRTASDERDRRDVLLQQLSEKLSITTVEQADGSVLVALPTGFPLVSGSISRSLAVTDSPSFSGGSLPPSLSGDILSYVVFDYAPNGGGAHLDLTQAIAAGEGTVGSLLQLRGYNAPGNTSAFQADGTLVGIAARIEALTRTLLTTVNQRYIGYDPNVLNNGDEDSGTAIFDSPVGDLDGLPPSVYGLFDFTGSADSDGNGVPDDLLALQTAGIDNFTSRLQLAFNDPRRIAAAKDLDATANSTSFSPGDGRNMEDLAGLQSQSNIAFTLTIPGPTTLYSLTSSFEAEYNETLTHVGNLRRSAEIAANVAATNLGSAQSRRDEVSGVSLDEEFTSLIRFQRAYQASAKMIRVADELLEQIANLI